jgi:nucleotide-binding universal stress UspA family protein
MVETDFSPEWMQRIEAAQKLTEAGAERLRKLFPGWHIQLEPSAGNPADMIAERAKAWPADLIVVGTHGRSAVGRAVLGSVSLKLIREAPCSVRVARANEHDGPIRLLIAVDGSTQAAATLTEVSRRTWPASMEAQVLAVQEVLVPMSAERFAVGEVAYEKVNEDEYFRMKHVAKIAADELNRSGLTASPIVMEGDPKHIVVQHARDWGATTIFVGASGLGRVEGVLLGSVSSATVAHAPCTVEVVRG